MEGKDGREKVGVDKAQLTDDLGISKCDCI